MFCDLVGSTALASRLDPEDLREVLGAYHAVVAEVVVKFGGYVAKYMGDGVLAYFGYPQAHEHDAEQAVRAGLALIDRVSRLESGAAALASRVGIATGLVVVGDLIGSGEAQERGVVGETPNLAARLQEMAPANAVLVAESTRRLVGDLFDYRDLGPVTIKGLAEPVLAAQVLGESTVENRFEALRSATLSPLVGRDEEVQLLLRRWARAKDGEGQIVLISGEAGIGKSRIVAALQERLEPERPIRLRYFCSPHRRDSALFPIIARLERAAGFTRDDAPAAKLDKLAALLSQSGDSAQETEAVFADLLGVPAGERYPPLPDDPRQKRERIFAALVRQLEDLAQHRPVLFLFEDAHWIEFDLARSAGSDRRARPPAAGADGRDLPPGVRAALDRPGAGDLRDIEPSRAAGNEGAGRARRRRQNAACRDPRSDRRARRRHPALYRGADQDAAGGQPAPGRERALYPLRSIANAGDPVEPA